MILFSESVKEMILKVACKNDTTDSQTLLDLISTLSSKSHTARVTSSNKIRYDNFTKNQENLDPHSILESSASVIESYSSMGGIDKSLKFALSRPFTCLQRNKSRNALDKSNERSSNIQALKPNKTTQNSFKNSFNDKENMGDYKFQIPGMARFHNS